MKPVETGSGIRGPIATAVFTCFAASAFAQEADTSLPQVTVQATRSVAEQNQLPVTTESVTADQAAKSINVMNAQDVLKYTPSVVVRQRFIGDTQAPMSSRTTGINASARTLLYTDGILLSALINNNNANGSPQWFMVSPEEIERIDVMYGPFSAMYPGNSYGAVTAITTSMPKKFEAGFKVSGATQNSSVYGTSSTDPAAQASMYLGDRSGDFSWRLSANHLDSSSQPLTFITATRSTAAAGGGQTISGAINNTNKTGGNILVVGAGNITHTVQDTARLKLAYDFSPSITAAYTIGIWQNDAKAHAESYLTDAAGAAYYGGTAVNINGNAYAANAISGFSSNTVQQQHLMQSLSLRAKNQGPWDWEAIATNFYYREDLTRTSTGPYPAALNSGPGTIADASGTGWSTADVKGIWHGEGDATKHIISFGAHYDQYKLVNPTYNTADWVSGGNGSLFSNSLGKTTTSALWAQDAWRLSPSIIATIGGRYESWRAFDGFNYSTSGGVGFATTQPGVTSSGFSPKLSLAWQASDLWSVTGSFGKALRFPTVGELYQNIAVGTTFVQANPFLRPERVLSAELALERVTEDSRLRASVFEEHVRDALISQSSTLPNGVASSFTQNVDSTRQRGIELVASRNNVLINGFDLTGSLTYVDAVITGNSSYVAPAATPDATSVGKRVPYVPKLRATIVASYRPDDHWAYTLAGRYSSRLYSTVDNTDVNTSTYQGFEGYFVADARMQYKFDRHWTGAGGIDNIGNRKYFLFHPFPERTVFAELKYTY
ncbi:TonB-dependent receptor [Oxalobacteraceae bacterium CAVE-383]|nr:TonB-dependent receptor [Oxalobacteraceae bacterium CAVE-383]